MGNTEHGQQRHGVCWAPCTPLYTFYKLDGWAGPAGVIDTGRLALLF